MLGPIYRIWLRNNSQTNINREFDVIVMVSGEENVSARPIMATKRIAGIAAGETITVNLRVPADANSRDAGTRSLALPMLYAASDANAELAESDEENNAAALQRSGIPLIDPRVTATDRTTAAPGTLIALTGEGFGRTPGAAIVMLGGLKMRAELADWQPGSVRLRVPPLLGAGKTDAVIALLRHDGKYSNAVAVTINATAPRSR